MANKIGLLKSLCHSNVNPVNNKSRTLPILNVIDTYGRTFHLSWIGFFVAFLSWFAFPPLIHDIIKKDLKLTHAQVANSNLIGLLATLIVRLVVGPLCDKYGPRYVMIGCLLSGAIPTALIPFITNATHLIIIRFFVGILGGTFVPCQVWTSLFFDKNIIGLTNALAAGFGNAGGGVTFFLMPAVVSSLIENHGFSQYWAWRIAFPLCPFLTIVTIAIITLLIGHDTPTGSWNDRHLHLNNNLIKTKNSDKDYFSNENCQITQINEKSSQIQNNNSIINRSNSQTFDTSNIINQDEKCLEIENIDPIETTFSCEKSETSNIKDQDEKCSQILNDDSVETPFIDQISEISKQQIDDAKIKTRNEKSSQTENLDENQNSTSESLFIQNLCQTSKQTIDKSNIDTSNEIAQSPTIKDVFQIGLSLKTLLVSVPYLCSFGSELAVEGIISDFYIQTAKNIDGIQWNSQTAGYWAAVFGLLNIITRPLGGLISDILYKHNGISYKKWWIIFLEVMQGIFFIFIGYFPMKISLLILSMTGLAIFMEAANGAVFSLVPSIHPKFNGIVSGVAGASGNIGGVLFCLIFRFLGSNYNKALWIIGIVCLSSNIAIISIPI